MSSELDPRLLGILVCPLDKKGLLFFADENLLYNPRLHRRYEVRDNIPVMLVEESEEVSADEHGRLMAKATADGLTLTVGS